MIWAGGLATQMTLSHSARGLFDYPVGAGERQSRTEGRHPPVEPYRWVRVPA
jgi:hypothetical protein